MKIQNPILSIAFSAALCTGLYAPASAQDLVQDTLAVRILLDQNDLANVPVSQVATVQSQRVVALDLTGRQLLTLPPEIGALSALKYLTLTDNLLDSLPAEIWDLTELIDLDLGGNQIKSLNPRIANLKKLLLLGLRGNELPSLPAELYSLPQLTTLLLAGNALDTVPEAIADPPFLKYVDLSDNQIKSIPYTMAAMDQLDSLDLSSNVLEILPDLITEMKASVKVRLGSNRLCNLGAALDAWAEGKTPGYKASQVCGSSVRPRAAHGAAPGLRAFSDGGFLRLEWSGLGSTAVTGAGAEVRIRGLDGKLLLREPVAPGVSGVEIPRADLGADRGFRWAELRLGQRTVAVTPVLPR